MNIHNAEHYKDPTASEALFSAYKPPDDEDLRVQAFIRALRTLISESGYDLLARIELKDRRTGRYYR